MQAAVCSEKQKKLPPTGSNQTSQVHHSKLRGVSLIPKTLYTAQQLSSTVFCVLSEEPHRVTVILLIFFFISLSYLKQQTILVKNNLRVSSPCSAWHFTPILPSGKSPFCDSLHCSSAPWGGGIPWIVLLNLPTVMQESCPVSVPWPKTAFSWTLINKYIFWKWANLFIISFRCEKTPATPLAAYIFSFSILGSEFPFWFNEDPESFTWQRWVWSNMQSWAADAYSSV